MLEQLYIMYKIK